MGKVRHVDSRDVADVSDVTREDVSPGNDIPLSTPAEAHGFSNESELDAPKATNDSEVNDHRHKGAENRTQLETINTSGDETTYPSGTKLAVTTTALALSVFLVALVRATCMHLKHRKLRILTG